MSDPLLTREFTLDPQGWMADGLIAVPGSTNGSVDQALSASDFLIGVCERAVVPGGGPERGGRCQVVLCGIADVRLGGAVGRGALLTSDYGGRAVAAVRGNSVIGRALASGAANDVIEVLLSPGVM